MNFMVEYEHREQSGSMYRATEKGETWENWLALVPDIDMPNDNRNISSNMGLGEEDNSNIWSYDLQVDWDLGFATLTSQTGYKDHEYVYAEDFDAMSVAVNDYAQNQKGTYFEAGVAPRLARHRRAVVVRRRFVLPGRDRCAVFATCRRRRDVSLTTTQGRRARKRFPVSLTRRSVCSKRIATRANTKGGPRTSI